MSEGKGCVREGCGRWEEGRDGVRVGKGIEGKGEGREGVRLKGGRKGIRRKGGRVEGSVSSGGYRRRGRREGGREGETEMENEKMKR